MHWSIICSPNHWWCFAMMSINKKQVLVFEMNRRDDALIINPLLTSQWIIMSRHRLFHIVTLDRQHAKTYINNKTSGDWPNFRASLRRTKRGQAAKHFRTTMQCHGSSCNASSPMAPIILQPLRLWRSFWSGQVTSTCLRTFCNCIIKYKK